MSEYVRKPATVQAEQFWPHIEPWPVGVLRHGTRCTSRGDGEWCELHNLAHLETTYRILRGPPELGFDTVPVRPGDWVVTDWQGLRSVVPDALFQLTYDPAAPHTEVTWWEHLNRPRHNLECAVRRWERALLRSTPTDSGESQIGAAPEQTRHGWAVEHGVTCVVCPECAYTFDAVHEVEAGGGYSCPLCAADSGTDVEALRDALNEAQGAVFRREAEAGIMTRETQCLRKLMALLGRPFVHPDAALAATPTTREE